MTLPLIGAVVVACAGCEKSPTTAPSTSSPPHVEVMPAIEQKRHTALGEATLDVEFTLDRVEMTVAERVNGTLVVTTRADAVVTMPAFGEDPARNAGSAGKMLGDFTVASSETSDRVRDGVRRTTMRFVLEPFLAGEKAVPVLEVRAKDGGKSLSLKTEAATIKVNAVAAKGDNEQTPLEAARGPVALVAPTAKGLSRPMMIGGAAAVVAMLASFGYMIVQSRRAKREADPLGRVRDGFERVRGMLGGETTREAAGAAADALHQTFAAYLRAGCGIPADTHSAAQLAGMAGDAGRVTPALRSEALSLLGEMERVRFAPDAVSATAVGTLLERCVAWVDTASLGGRA